MPRAFIDTYIFWNFNCIDFLFVAFVYLLYELKALSELPSVTLSCIDDVVAIKSDRCNNVALGGVKILKFARPITELLTKLPVQKHPMI